MGSFPCIFFKIEYHWVCSNNLIAGLAQLVEQLIYTEKVGGSSPSSRTNKKTLRRSFCLCGIESQKFGFREGRENPEYAISQNRQLGTRERSEPDTKGVQELRFRKIAYWVRTESYSI